MKRFCIALFHKKHRLLILMPATVFAALAAVSTAMPQAVEAPGTSKSETRQDTPARDQQENADVPLEEAASAVEDAGKPEKEELVPTAEEILEQAAKAQGGARITGDLKSFYAEFETNYFKKDEGKVYYQVKRIFKFPCLMWTEKKHDIQDGPSYEVYNGEDSWFVTPEGKMVVYTDKPSTFKTDIENLEKDMRLTKQMFRYFFIANLAEEIKALKRLANEPLPFSRKKDTVFLLEGRTTGWIGGDHEIAVYLKIYIEPEQRTVLAVRMTDPNKTENTRLFLFDEYLRNKQGVLVPVRVKMYPGDAVKPEMTVYMNCRPVEDESGKETVIPVIEFNMPVDAALFNLPEEEEEEV